MKAIEFEGQVFYQDAKQLYYRAWNAERGRPEYLHRRIWASTHGPIPEGFEVHHKDENRENNNIENLEALTVSDHRREHWGLATQAQLKAMRENLNRIRPLATEWHRSKDGRQWHSEATKKQIAERVHVLNCDQCGQEIIRVGVIQKGRFCSNNCKSANRRASGVDTVSRNCDWCAQVFTCNKYSKALTCSQACTNRKRHADRESHES